MRSSSSKSIKSSISKNIQKYLETNNLSKLNFAKSLNVSHTTVNRWIKCECAPELELFPQICDMLNMTIYEFIGVDDPSTLTKNEIEILKLYVANINFKTLIDRYRSDEEFQKTIDKIIEL